MEFEVSAELVAIYLEDAREQLRVLDDVLLRAEKEGPERVLRLERRLLGQERPHPPAAAGREPALLVRVEDRLPPRVPAAARAGVPRR